MKPYQRTLKEMAIEDVIALLRDIKEQGIGFTMELIEYYEGQLQGLNYNLDGLASNAENMQTLYNELKKKYDKPEAEDSA
jgi:hypothetical protein